VFYQIDLMFLTIKSDKTFNSTMPSFLFVAIVLVQIVFWVNQSNTTVPIVLVKLWFEQMNVNGKTVMCLKLGWLDQNA